MSDTRTRILEIVDEVMLDYLDRNGVIAYEDKWSLYDEVLD